MTNSHFSYTTYIVANAEFVWKGLTESKYTRLYFFGRTVESDWQIGSLIRYWQPNGKLAAEGMITESIFQQRLALRWRSVWNKTLKERPESTISYRIDALGEVSRLTLMQSYQEVIEEPKLKLIRRISTITMAGLKTLLETGKPLPKFNVMG